MSVTAVIILASVTTLSLLVCYLDARYNLKLAGWLSGNVSNPFTDARFSSFSSSQEKQPEDYEALKRRIETLEAIVTEPSYELNKKINDL
ncbi:hypothetical protein [Aestuariibacter sp. A3R04]|uniref:hypothetical protein n=1 Tax=Aestuariibacter sp. A3R04 TaxID=2841571 RepID=UPI001C098DFF|nr:hypothetical protein [Aestuariibacter sp. A3R04]MBU3020285.1 hypothetical protein [Aestuariibacter sp. A3R04]